MGIITLLSINKEQILKWIDTGCLIAFIVSLALVLILFLRGLLRGWKAGTYHLVAMAVFFIVPLFFLGMIADAIGGINIGQWIKDPIVITAGGRSVSIQPTTVFETVYNVIYALLHDLMRLNASAATTANYAIALAGSLIRLVIVFLWAIVTLTIGSLFITFLWHVGFKHIIRKEKRKPKLRIVSALEEAIAFLAIAIVGIAPLSGLLNTIKNNAQIPPQSSNETVLMVRDVIDTYDKSIFNQAFFAWTKGSGTDTLDTQIAQFFAQNSYKIDEVTYNANIVKEARIFAGVEGSLVGTLFAEQPNQALVSSLIHTSLLMGQSLYLMAQGENELLDTLVPLTYDVARNADLLMEEFDGGLSDDFAISKKARMQAFDAIAPSSYVQTIETGAAESYFAPVYNGLTSFSTRTLDNVEEKIARDERAHAFVNSVVSGYVYEDYLKNDDSAFDELLPKNAMGELDEERFGQIDWFKEARVFRHTRDAVSALPKMANASSDEEMMADYLARAAKNMDAIIDVIVGQRDSSGKPITDENGDNRNGVCLLDSDLLSTVLPAVLQYGSFYLDDSILTDEEDPADFLDSSAAIAETLTGDRNRPAEGKINYKTEFGAILDVIGDITQHEAGQEFLADYKNHPGLEFAQDGTLIDFEPDIAEAFMEGIANLDRSQLLAFAAPILGDHFTRPLLASDGTLGKMGITRLDFHVASLGARLSDLLSVGKYCSDLLASFGSIFKTGEEAGLSPNNFFSAMTSLETEAKHYQVTHLLDIITDSPIINPDYVVAGKTTTNCNLANLLQYFLSGIDPDTEFNLDADALDGMELAGTWNGATLTKKGDNFFTAQVFKQIAETGIIEEIATLADSSSTKAIETLSTIGIDTLFDNIGKSQVLRKLLPPFFDTNLLGTLLNSDKALNLETIGVSYENLTTPQDWTDEGIAMQAILNLAANGLDLSNLDIFDPTIIDLMHELAASRIFVMPDGEYVFGTYFTDKMLSALTDVGQFKLFTDFPDKEVASFGNKTVSQVLAEKGDAYWGEKNAQVLEDKKALASVFVRAMQLPQGQEGWAAELENLRVVVACVSGLGGIDGLTDFNSDSLPSIVLALQALGETDSLGTVLSGNLFRKAFESGKVSDAINAKNVNTGWFDRNAEAYVTAMETNGFDRKAAAVSAVLSQRTAEMNYMTSLIKLAVTNDSIKTGEFNFGNLDVDGFLRPLFYAARNSKVLNPTSPADLYSSKLSLPEFTSFEDLILRFVKNSGVYAYVDAYDNPVKDYTPETYDTVYIKGTRRTIKSIIKSITATGTWDKETEALCGLVDVLQESSFLVDGQISFDVFSSKEGLQEFFAKEGSREELVDLMSALEESELYYRCLPNKLERAITDALQSVTFGHISEDVACADFYLYEGGSKTDFPRYSTQGKYNTVEGLVDVFVALSACTELDMSDFTTLNVDALMDALSIMATSPVFNSDTKKSQTIFATLAPERAGMTAFQALFCDVLSVDSLNQYTYYADSPKDAYYLAQGEYSDANTKVAYNIRQLFPALDGTNAATLDALGQKYIQEELGNCLFTFKEDRFASFVSGDVKFSNLDEDSFVTLLTALNDCTLMRDCVPNAAHKTLILDDTINVAGIALSSADIFFSYYCHDGEGNFSPDRKSTPDFSMPFYQPEIDQIAMIYSTLNDPSTKEILSTMKMKTLDPVLARNILLDLHDSYIFHESAKYNRDTTSPVLVNSLDPSMIENFPSLTVFEQFIYKIMYKANLLSMNYSAAKFYEYSFDQNGQFIDKVGSYYKGHDDIVAVTLADTWLNEINALTTDGLHHEGTVGTTKDPIVGIVAAAQDAGMFSDENNDISIDYNATKIIAPDKIRGLLYALNDSQILDDSMPLSMNSLLGTHEGDTSGGIGLNKYTSTSYGYAVTAGEKTVDMRNVAALYDDGDTSKTFHPVREITLPVTGAITSGANPEFQAIYHKDATTDIDMTALFKASDYDSVAGTVTLTTVDSIWYPVEITLTGAASFTTGDVDFLVDYADYDIGREAYASNGIDAIGYLLSSAYRGENYPSRYFSFNDYASDATLSSFFDEKKIHKSDFDHSTYGLLVLFSDSGFYEAGLDAAGNFTTGVPNHSASAFALFSALKFKVSAEVDVTIDTALGPVTLPTANELSLGSLIGQGSTDAEHLKALEGYLADMTLAHMDYVTKEAYWFDNFAASAGTFAAYDEAIHAALESAYSDEIKYVLVGGVDSVFAISPNDAVGEIMKSLTSTFYDYSIDIPLSDYAPEHYEGTAERPDIGSSAVANLITSVATHKGEGLKLSFDAPTAAFGTSTKDTRVSTTDFADDLFDSDFALMDAAYLNEVHAAFGLMKTFYVNAQTTFTAEQKLAVKEGFETLSDVGGAANFNKIFYVSALYDSLIYVPLTKVNGVFDALNDLPSFVANGLIAGAATPLTFGAIAQLYA